MAAEGCSIDALGEIRYTPPKKVVAVPTNRPPIRTKPSPHLTPIAHSANLPGLGDEMPVGESTQPVGRSPTDGVDISERPLGNNNNTMMSEFPDENSPNPEAPKKPIKKFLKRGTGKTALAAIKKEGEGETETPPMDAMEKPIGARKKGIAKDAVETEAGKPKANSFKPPEEPPASTSEWSSACSGIYDLVDAERAEVLLGCLGAKNFQLREWALSGLKDLLLEEGKTKKGKDLVRHLAYFLGCMEYLDASRTTSSIPHFRLL